MNPTPISPRPRWVWIALCSLACFTPLLAQTSESATALPDHSQMSVVDPAPEVLDPIRHGGYLQTDVGAGYVLSQPVSIERFAIGNEEVANVHVVSDREVLIQGLIPGRTTIFVWLADGRRLRFSLRVRPDLNTLKETFGDLVPGVKLRTSHNGEAVVLSGRVDNQQQADQVRALAAGLLGVGTAGAPRLVDFLTYPGVGSGADLRLSAALEAVDPRIRVRRIQVGLEPDNSQDSLILEGRVRDVQALKRAISLAELQLGGNAGSIRPMVEEEEIGGRIQGLVGSGNGGLQNLQGSRSSPSGLSAQVAKGLVLQSESGRTVSFLDVDEIPQILVSIRVLQIDRGKARRVGLDFRVDGEDFSLASISNPGSSGIPAPIAPPTITDVVGGNLVASFIEKTVAVTTALDLLEEKEIARSMAEPNLTALSGEQASVLVGGEVPIPTTTVGGDLAVQGFFFQDFGVRLDVRPTLTSDGFITIEMAPSIVRPSNTLAVGGVPGFQIQRVQTTARVPPGQSLVIGGLLSFEEGLELRGTPGLSKVPILKHLFSWQRRSRQQQELLFVITPKLLKTPEVNPEKLPTWHSVQPIEPFHEVPLPALEWPEEKRWKDAVEPGELQDNGLPPSFRAAAPSAERDAETRAEELRAGEEPAGEERAKEVPVGEIEE